MHVSIFHKFPLSIKCGCVSNVLHVQSVWSIIAIDIVLDTVLGMANCHSMTTAAFPFTFNRLVALMFQRISGQIGHYMTMQKELLNMKPPAMDGGTASCHR